jgi:hypothetical protein
MSAGGQRQVLVQELELFDDGAPPGRPDAL